MKVELHDNGTALIVKPETEMEEAVLCNMFKGQELKVKAFHKHGISLSNMLGS